METNEGFPPQRKKLYRSNENKVLAGVCGGIGEYLGINPVWIRLLWVLISIEGFGVLAYIVAAILMPRNSHEEAATTGSSNAHTFTDCNQNASLHNEKSAGGLVLVLGGLLIVSGVYYLLNNFNLIPWELMYTLKYIVRNAFLPIVLIVIGLLMIIFRNKK